ncbi:MAG TPA: hypothetical protein VGF55_07630, partial [Gemmataceae bacterium]
MTGRGAIWAGGLLALAVPGLALTCAADAGRADLGLAVAPFGPPRLVVVHLLAGLPLALGLAAWWTRQI